MGIEKKKNNSPPLPEAANSPMLADMGCEMA